MSIQDSLYIERNHQYKNKLAISKEILKLTADFYSALKVLANLEDQKMNSLTSIKNFASLFYEHECVYKGYIQKWEIAIDKEIEAIKDRSSFFRSIGNFASELKKAFEPLQVN